MVLFIPFKDKGWFKTPRIILQDSFDKTRTFYQTTQLTDLALEVAFEFHRTIQNSVFFKVWKSEIFISRALLSENYTYTST